MTEQVRRGLNAMAMIVEVQRASIGEVDDAEEEAEITAAVKWIRSCDAMKLRPMSEATKTGPAVEILAAITDTHGNRNWIVVHYAFGGGEDQPPFRGWFYRIGDGFAQVDERRLLGWVEELPEVPAAQRFAGERPR